MKKNSNIVFYVNEEKRTVVAKLSDVRQEVWQMATSISHKEYHIPCEIADIFSYDDRIFGKVPNTLTGKAVCSPLDTFDVEVGKTLAQARLLQKVYNYRAIVLQDIGDIISDIMSKVEDSLNFVHDRYWYYTDIEAVITDGYDYENEYEDKYEYERRNQLI